MNRENLKKLADYLLSNKLKANFNMEFFTGEVNEDQLTECGTIGCAIGHGPYAGIKKSAYEAWWKYSERVFGLDTGSDEWVYLFGHGWAYTDNTPQGSAKRINHLLENGLPSNWEEQMGGNAPLSYL